jgi:hypothetical protein
MKVKMDKNKKGPSLLMNLRCGLGGATIERLIPLLAFLENLKTG